MFLNSQNLVIFTLLLYIEQVLQDKLVKQISEFGYHAEVHKIVTEDGYILKTYRIPHGRASNKTNTNVILLVHGIATSADLFILLGPDDALAFYLADEGFDVWLFNARGTAHSRKHTTRSANYLQGTGFWNFSWHEIGVYDLPDNIDYILKKTNKPDLMYLGYSQGATSYFVMTSEKPEYNNKIRATVLLAPAVLMMYTESSLMKFLSRFEILLERLTNMFNYQELVVPNSPMLNNILKGFCLSSDDFKEACRDFISMVGGQESGLINISLLSTIIDATPSGFSVRQALHYAQIIRSGSFRQYNCGKNENLKRYNNTVPPEYDLNSSLAPVALFMANGDNVASVKVSFKIQGLSKSIYELSKLLPNVALIYEVPYDNFNHLDYLTAYNAKELVYKPLYDFLTRFFDN